MASTSVASELCILRGLMLMQPPPHAGKAQRGALPQLRCAGGLRLHTRVVAGDLLRRAHCALLVVAAAVGGCGNDTQVSIVLTRDESLAVAPLFVRFVFEVKDDEAVEDGPFAVDSVPDNAFVGVPPRASFAVDVIGCTQNDRETCEEPADFVGRGCAGPFSRERDTELVIDVVMFSTALGNERCPVEP